MAPEIGEHRTEALLAEYAQLREEVRARSSFNQKQLARGMGVVGLVGGYAVYSERLVLVTIIPMIIVVVGTLVTHTLATTYLLGLRVGEIEAELPGGTSMWEHQYSGLSGNPRWAGVPGAITILLLGIGFVFSTVVSVAVVADQYRQFLLPSVAFYLFLLGLAAVSYVSLRKTKRYAQSRMP